MHPALVKLARPLEFALGVTFIAAAVLKALDPNLFVAQVYSYQVVKAPELLRLVALGTLGIETFLGTAMILGLRLRMLVLSLVEAMLVVFTGLILYAWLVHGLEDCGCFGRIKMSPPASILKNVIMFIAAAIAWRGIHQKGLLRQGGAIWRTLVSLAAATALVAYAEPQLSKQKTNTPPPAPPTQETSAPPPTTNGNSPDAETPAAPLDPALPEAAGPAPFAQFQVHPETGETLDLGKGEYLVASLSMTCEHCMGTVPHLNDLSYYPDLPKMVGLAYEPEEGSMRDFKAQANPAFPLHSIGNDFILFSQFIGTAPPRLTYVKDGREVKHWDALEPEYKFPEYDEVLAVVQAGAPAAAASSPQ